MDTFIRRTVCLLLAKLEAYGFSLKSTTFIQSYLNKRVQKVNVNNKFSAWEVIYSGVPKGSILGPLIAETPPSSRIFEKRF